MKKRYFNMIPSPDTACILLYGEIGGFDGISDKDIVAELYEYASMYKSIDIRVNSPGGRFLQAKKSHGWKNMVTFG